ncbi:hypothetical protein PoB_001203300 [Plakobranchus ocellatus]|uniref:Uncharacterized protein n=1 Tax=Plakobranchus ocellatus TaxID=259542 RepID=A0AAV3YT27_9GAST|nr:hypothetical protein PoB_001203300 [Plakobranchus ocellatus]
MTNRQWNDSILVPYCVVLEIAVHGDIDLSLALRIECINKPLPISNSNSNSSSSRRRRDKLGMPSVIHPGLSVFPDPIFMTIIPPACLCIDLDHDRSGNWHSTVGE